MSRTSRTFNLHYWRTKILQSLAWRIHPLLVLLLLLEWLQPLIFFSVTEPELEALSSNGCQELKQSFFFSFFSSSNGAINGGHSNIFFPIASSPFYPKHHGCKNSGHLHTFLHQRTAPDLPLHLFINGDLSFFFFIRPSSIAQSRAAPMETAPFPASSSHSHIPSSLFFFLTGARAQPLH